MTNAKEIACKLRWILLVLWLLCLGGGIFWIIAPFLGDKYGPGLGGTPNVIVMGPFVDFFENWGKLGYLIFIFIYLALFFLTQWLFLFPNRFWKVELKPAGRPLKKSAIAAAFAVTLLSVGLGYSLWNLFGGGIFEYTEGQNEGVHPWGTYLILSIPLLVWIVWSIIFCVYWRQSDHYTWAGRVIRGLIGGSILELFVSIPIYVTRQDECYCARGSYAGLVFGATVLLWAFGPGIFLLFIREKQRREKLLEGLKAEDAAGKTLQ